MARQLFRGSRQLFGGYCRIRAIGGDFKAFGVQVRDTFDLALKELLASRPAAGVVSCC